MSSQILKSVYIKEKLFSFLDKITQKYDKYYKIDKISFKKAEYLNILNSFCEELKDYYYNPKQFYVTRKLTYNNFLTIIRQICKKNNLIFEKKISYQKSIYDITYFIYFE